VSFFPWLIRRWWFWALVVVLLLECGVLSIRWSGRAAWHRELAAVRAAGGPTSLVELAARAPFVSSTRQSRLYQWSVSDGRGQYGASDVLPPRTVAGIWMAATLGQDRPSAQAVAHIGEIPSLPQLSVLLSEGTLVWGVQGWLRKDPSGWKIYGFTGRTERTAASQDCLFAAANAYSLRATLDGDAAALEHLDQLLQTTAAPALIAEAEARVAVAGCRDATYLGLVAEGRLDPVRAAAWLVETSDAASALISGLQGERVLWVVEEGNLRFHLDVGWRDLWDRPSRASWRLVEAMMQQHLTTALSQRIRSVETVLRGTRNQPGSAVGSAPDMGGPALRPLTWIQSRSDIFYYLPIEPDLVVNCLQATNHHRMTRAAAVATTAWRSGDLPANHAQAEVLMGGLLHAEAHLLPPLVYERLSPTRFRLGLDPAGPLPACTDRDHLQAHTTIGQPAAAEAAVDEPWSLELDCAGLSRTSPPAAAAPPPAAP
jgi:hypothetical protein